MTAARTMRHVHGGVVIAACVLWAVAAWQGWLTSVAFVSHLSVAAIVYTGITAWQGARAEEKADEE